jgi:hypothetical protein
MSHLFDEAHDDSQPGALKERAGELIQRGSSG